MHTKKISVGIAADVYSGGTMDGTLAGTLIGAGSSLATYLVNSLNERLKEQRSERRERQTKAEERRITRSIKSTEFQRATLLALQDAINDVQDTVRIKHSAAWRTTNSGRPVPMPESDFAEMQRKINHVRLLIARVHDSAVRSACLGYLACTFEIGPKDDLSSLQELLKNALAALSTAHDKIGHALRELDTEEGKI